MKRKGLLVLIIITVMGCNQYPENAQQYYVLKNELSNELIDHFPDKFNYKNSFSIIQPPSRGKYAKGIKLILGLKKNNDFDSLNIMNPDIINPDDTCNMIVNRFYYDDSNEEILKESQRLTKYCKNGVPVPNFAIINKMLGEDELNYQLPDDFIIYKYNSKQGIFLKENELTKGIGLPKEWQNGYSKGIAVSKKRSICIYWLIVW